MTEDISIDGLILGGGIAGLWSLRALTARGYRVLLLDTGDLGDGQTIHSQGIIHGGAKYSLSGVVSSATQAICAMPKTWQSCFSGQGPIDLRATKILSRHHQMWSGNRFTTGLIGVMASTLMQAEGHLLSREDYPEIFRHKGFRGQIHSLDELVVDSKSLLENLQDQHQHLTYRLGPENQLIFDRSPSDRRVTGFQIVNQRTGGSLKITTSFVLSAAAAGQDFLASTLAVAAPTQKRPLHMVYAIGDQLPLLYGHLIQAGTVPKLTLTSHPLADGRVVWYFGGGLAEDGCDLTSAQQLTKAESLLRGFFSWFDFGAIEWHSFLIDRHEPKTPHHKKPKECVVIRDGNVLLAWPTKLTFAPLLADKVIDELSRAGMIPGKDRAPFPGLNGFLAEARVAQPYWERHHA